MIFIGHPRSPHVHGSPLRFSVILVLCSQHASLPSGAAGSETARCLCGMKARVRQVCVKSKHWRKRRCLIYAYGIMYLDCNDRIRIEIASPISGFQTCSPCGARLAVIFFPATVFLSHIPHLSRQVGKENQNHGRLYYSCVARRCRFFKWADDAPPLPSSLKLVWERLEPPRFRLVATQGFKPDHIRQVCSHRE